MSKFREKAQGRTMQMVGEMIGDEQLVQEGNEQERHAEQESRSQNDPPEPATSPH